MVAKPAEQDPLGPITLAKLLMEAGVPEGVINVVPGVGPTAGAALAAHPDVRCIAFTGSTATGKKVIQTGAETVKNFHLQLGGKAPMIVLPDANMEQAVYACMRGAFLHAGQICECTTRLFLHENIYQPFMDMLVEKTRAIQPGDPLNPATGYAAVITPQHLAKIEASVEQGLRPAPNLRAAASDPPTHRTQAAIGSCPPFSPMCPENPCWTARKSSARYWWCIVLTM